MTAVGTTVTARQKSSLKTRRAKPSVMQNPAESKSDHLKNHEKSPLPEAIKTDVIGHRQAARGASPGIPLTETAMDAAARQNHEILRSHGVRGPIPGARLPTAEIAASEAERHEISAQSGQGPE